MFHCYVIIDCWLTLIPCTFQRINKSLTYLLTYCLRACRENAY